MALAVIFSTDKLKLHLLFNAYVSETLNPFFEYLTYIGDGFFVLGVVALLLFFNTRKALTLLLCYGLSAGFTQGIKYGFFPDADRPSLVFEINHLPLKLAEGVDVNIHRSFPSGHTTAAFSLFFCLSLFSGSKSVKILCFLGALLVAFSRVYLSQHFFEDITAGSFIAVFFSFFICHILNETVVSQRLTKLEKPVWRLS